MFLKANWPERNRSCPTSRTPQAHDSLFLFWFHLVLFSTITATWRWVQKKEERKKSKKQTNKQNDKKNCWTIQMYVCRPWIHLHNFLLKITIDKSLPMPHPHPTPPTPCNPARQSKVTCFQEHFWCFWNLTGMVVLSNWSLTLCWTIK